MDGSRLLKLYIEYTEKGYAVLKNAVSEEHIVAFEEEFYKERNSSANQYASYIQDRSAYKKSSVIRDVMCSRALSKFLSVSPRTYELQMVEARKGSSQIDWHIDYFGSDEEPWDEFVVVQICLEDVTVDSGPLEIIDGSHMWKTDWSIITNENCVNSLTSCFEYYRNIVKYHAKEPRVFLGKRGDIILWSGYSMHRGTMPASLEASRHSMIGRFNAFKDIEPNLLAGRIKRHNGLFYTVS